MKFTKDHEWVSLDGDIATVGISKHAADALGDVVFVDLPAVGTAVKQFGAFGAVESVKAVSDLFSPLSGTVLVRNEALVSSPGTVNTDPYGAGWLVELSVANAEELAGLLDAAGYAALIP